MTLGIFRIFATAVIGLAAAHLSAQDFSPCGPLVTGGFGPFDYRTASEFDRKLVESAHFTPDVANLRAGSTGTLGADLDYTLRAFPNHPRALLAMSTLGQRTKVTKPAGAKWSVDCYFDRALRWRSDDPAVRLVLGIHLVRHGKTKEAHTQLEIAENNAIDNGGFHYNLGLAFLDAGDDERALAHAWRAYALGYDLPGLRNRLQKSGKWRDPDK